MDNNERRAKAIGGAFSFHPGTWRGPKLAGSWVIGPTFAVKAEPSDTYEKNPAFGRKLKFWLENSDGHQSVEPSTRPHFRVGIKATCKARRLVSGGKETGYEIAFPLLSLARAAGVERYTAKGSEVEGVPVAVFGFNGDSELVAIFAGRRVGEACGEEKVPAPKKVSSRPRKPKGKRPMDKVQELP